MIFSSVSHSVVSDSATPWTAAHQASLSMGFPRQEYWSGFLFPPLGDLPNPGTESTSPSFVGRLFFFFYIYTEPLGKPQGYGIP